MKPGLQSAQITSSLTEFVICVVSETVCQSQLRGNNNFAPALATFLGYNVNVFSMFEAYSVF